MINLISGIICRDASRINRVAGVDAFEALLMGKFISQEFVVADCTSKMLRSVPATLFFLLSAFVKTSCQLCALFGALAD